MRALVLVVACGCGSAKPVTPSRPSPPPKDALVEGDAAGCPEGFRRFADRHQPARFSFCAPAGSRVGWFSSADEHAGTLDYVVFRLDDSASFSVVATERTPPDGIGPGEPTNGTLELDRGEPFAGRDGRHFRLRMHEHRERSFDLDEHGNHTHEEASDHDAAVEVWGAIRPAGGTLRMQLRTQENTSAASSALLRRVAGTFRIETW